jgi:hypothetical protein
MINLGPLVGYTKSLKSEINWKLILQQLDFEAGKVVPVLN